MFIQLGWVHKYIIYSIWQHNHDSCMQRRSCIIIVCLFMWNQAFMIALCTAAWRIHISIFCLASKLMIAFVHQSSVHNYFMSCCWPSKTVIDMCTQPQCIQHIMILLLKRDFMTYFTQKNSMHETVLMLMPKENHDRFMHQDLVT